MTSTKLTLKDFQDDVRLYRHYIKMSAVMRALDTSEPLPGATVTIVDGDPPSIEKRKQMNFDDDFDFSESKK